MSPIYVAFDPDGKMSAVTREHEHGIEWYRAKWFPREVREVSAEEFAGLEWRKQQKSIAETDAIRVPAVLALTQELAAARARIAELEAALPKDGADNVIVPDRMYWRDMESLPIFPFHCTGISLAPDGWRVFGEDTEGHRVIASPSGVSRHHPDTFFTPEEHEAKEGEEQGK